MIPVISLNPVMVEKDEKDVKMNLTTNTDANNTLYAMLERACAHMHTFSLVQSLVSAGV